MSTTNRVTTRQIDALVDRIFEPSATATSRRSCRDSSRTPSTTSRASSEARSTVASRSRPSTGDCSKTSSSTGSSPSGAGMATTTSSTSRSCTRPRSGTPFGLPGRGRRVSVRILHVFDFAGEMITRESAWLDVAAIMAQLD